jgi:hypothetical protein
VNIDRPPHIEPHPAVELPRLGIPHHQELPMTAAKPGETFRATNGALLTVEPTDPGQPAVELWTLVHGEESPTIRFDATTAARLADDLAARARLLSTPDDRDSDDDVTVYGEWAVFCGDPEDGEDIVGVFLEQALAEELAQRVIDAHIGYRQVTRTDPAWQMKLLCGGCGSVLTDEMCCDGRTAEIEAGQAVLARGDA